MKTFRKALSIILGLAMMLSCVAGMQVSVAAEGTVAVSVGEATVADGVVTVPVVVDSNTGFQAMTVTVDYDNTVLTLASAAKDTTYFSAKDSAVFGPTDAETFKMMWAFAEEKNDVTATGTIATLTFNVVEGVDVDSTDIDLTVTEAWDVDGNEVTATATGGTVEFVKECTHDWGTGVVTTQPTKDAEGVRTYTCSLCGETKTEAIAMPVATTAVTFKADIVVSSVVGANITISTKQMRTAYGDNASYFIVVDYQKYGLGYVLENKKATLTTADRIEDGVSSNANKDVITFKDIALYEMTLDFTMTAYFVDGNGVVVGYRTFDNNVAAMAATYCTTYSSNAKLLTSMADMCAYGDAAQNYFAKANPGTPICDATLPSEILGETFMACKSTTEGMPAAGEYNNAKSSTKVVSTTGFVSAGQTLKIDASNFISYTLRYDNYDWNDVEIKVSYNDSIYGDVEYVVTEEELIDAGTTSAGMPKFTYYFKDLGLYDCDKTVTMNMYYKGNLELTSEYSFGNYVNTYLSNASMSELLTTMELFSNSIGIQLGLNARW